MILLQLRHTQAFSVQGPCSHPGVVPVVAHLEQNTTHSTTTTAGNVWTRTT